MPSSNNPASVVNPGPGKVPAGSVTAASFIFPGGGSGGGVTPETLAAYVVSLLGLESSPENAVTFVGTPSTGLLQSLTGLGTTGQVLTSGGAGVLPSWVTPVVYAPTNASFWTATAEGSLSNETNLGALTGGGLLKHSVTGGVSTPSNASANSDYVAPTGACTLYSKTLDLPTISGTGFTNANHAHTAANSGGQLTDAALSAAVGVAKGGTGLTTAAINSLVCSGTTTTGVFQTLSNGTLGQVLLSGGAGVLPSWGAGGTLSHNHTTGSSGDQLTDAALSSAVGVAKGGTGLTTATTAWSVVCSGTTATGAFQVLSGIGAAGQVLTSNGASALPTWQAAGGGGAPTSCTFWTSTAEGSLSNETNLGALTGGGLLKHSVTGGVSTPSNASANSDYVAPTGACTLYSKTLDLPTISGTGFTNANHNHTAANSGGQLTDAALSGAVGVTKGGTGLTSTAAWTVVCGGATANTALQQVASVGTAGQVLISNAAGLPTWSTSPTIGMTNANHNHTTGAQGGTLTEAALTGQIPVGKGGTGASTLAAYAVVCGGTTTAGPLVALASNGVTGQYLSSNGPSALPSWVYGGNTNIIRVNVTSANMGGSVSSAATIPVNAVVVRTIILTRVAFTGAAPTCTIDVDGTSDTNLAATSDSDITTLGQDDVYDLKDVTATGPVRVTMGGTASAGSASVYVIWAVPAV
jgi:hypothetical protein